ncbi:MAG TPA: helix-turn-helix domain-containing protein [Balneolaceae bacterium]|nr:helix-turn-helix domain-containing protein [Balneolaceae bacterium]
MKTSISQSHSHISNQKRELLSNALKFLEVRIKTIHTVTQWATRMGYSRCYFSRHIHKIYGETAISILHKTRLAAICEALYNQPSAKAFTVARETGFKDDKSMGQFLSRNFHIVTADVRTRVGGDFDKLEMRKEEIYCYFTNRVTAG